MKVKSMMVSSKMTLTRNYNSFSSESNVVVEIDEDNVDLKSLHSNYSNLLNEMNKSSILSQINSVQDVNIK